MYKVASDLAQRSASRILPRDAAGGEQVLTDEQRRDSLVAKLRALDARIQAEPSKIRRKALGMEKHALQNEISAIRKKKKAPGVEQFFIAAARDILGKSQYQLIMAEAVKRLREADAA